MLQQLFDFDYVQKWKPKKIENLLGDADNDSSKFTTRKWNVINDQNNTDYGEGNEYGKLLNLKQIH